MRFLVIGALAWDAPVRLSGALRSGARLTGRPLPERLGGGGANAGCAIARAGHQACVATYLGQDARADALRNAAERAGLDLSLCSSHDHPTGQTQILIEPSGERAILHVRAFDSSATAPALPPLLADVGAFDGVFVRAHYPGAADIAMTHAGPVILHWPPSRIMPFPADVLVGSRDDLDGAFGTDPLREARAEVSDRLRWVVLTDGANGATAYGEAGSIHQPAHPASLVDATGAGDVFAAGLLEALAAGASIGAALDHASGWAKVVVEREYSALCDPATDRLVAFAP